MHTIITNRSRQRNSDEELAPPSISTRAFIQWLPDPKTEPTSTLVLTSSEKFYVDIRVLRKRNSISGENGKEKLRRQTTEEETADLILSKDLDWAFAGRSTSYKDESTGITDSRWLHTVDSRFLARPTAFVDAALMEPEDPETGLTLEKGAMMNPESGHEEAYVEGWLEIEPRDVPEPHCPAPGDPWEDFERGLPRRGIRFVECEPWVRRLSTSNAILSLPATSSEQQPLRASKLDLRCVVLEHENAAKLSRGMVIRLGQFCQGVLQVGEEFAAERWEWTSRFGWRRMFVSGNLDMPCDVACYMATKKLRAGSEVRYGVGDDRVWQVVEEHAWERFAEDRTSPPPLVAMAH